MWGVSITGALFSTAVSEDGVDPFYPSAYGAFVRAADLLKQNVDWCLSSSNANRMYNYKVPSTCIADKEQYDIKPLPMEDPVKEMITDVWKN